MCTLTWLTDEAGLRVFFNRDEKRTRAPALPPQVTTLRGTPILAPLDGQAGGTWITANAYGLVVALLNYYEATPVIPQPGTDATTDNPPHASRGHLVLGLADLPSAEAVRDQIQHLPLNRYPPFLLFALDDTTGGLETCWDGQQLTVKELTDQRRPVTTSSFRTSEVLAARRQTLDELVTASGWHAEAARSFHRSGHSRGEAYAVCMTRTDAMTVSYTEILVAPDRIAMTYATRDQHQTPPTLVAGHEVTLSRMNAPAKT